MVTRRVNDEAIYMGKIKTNALMMAMSMLAYTCCGG